MAVGFRVLLCAAVSATLTTPAAAAVTLKRDTNPKTIPGPPFTTNSLTVGNSALGSLLINKGDVLTVNGLSQFGVSEDGKGLGIIGGKGSSLTSGRIWLGVCGLGVLDVVKGGAVSTKGDFVVGRGESACKGSGLLNVSSGASVTAGRLVVGDEGAKGIVRIGANSTVTVVNDAVLGSAFVNHAGDGSVQVAGRGALLNVMGGLKWQ